jgi:uncharacterized membrane protein YkvA (DUF1232 family)
MKFMRPGRLLRSFNAIKRELPRVVPLFRDPAVPLWAKLLTVAAALFIVSPLNILGDLPLLGFFDEAALLALVIHRFVSFAESRSSVYVATSGGPLV